MTTIDAGQPAAQSPADLPGDVLIVEDDPLIALDLSETIMSFGVASVRTAGTVAGALQQIDERKPDFVLLDLRLGGEKSFAVAQRLKTLMIPFAFTTGYVGTGGVPAAFADVAVLIKPYVLDNLRIALQSWHPCGRAGSP